MSITTELREWARDNTVQGEVLTTHPVQHPVHGTLESLLAIADRIDATYEADVNTACKLANALSADELAEHGWVKLPVDADGVPIRVGDVVRMELMFSGMSKPLVVDRMELSHGRDGDLWHVALDTDKGCWNQPSLMRHYTPPTVEDVLDEFVARWMDTHHDDLPALKAEYAAKLRLAEGEDA